MNIQCTLSDMFIRIKNTKFNKKKNIYCFNSKINKNILNILCKEGYINKFNIFKKYIIEINLKYYKNNSVIDDIILISKPSLRVYYNINKIKKISIKNGIIIISTSKGIMTHKDARFFNIGGEAICYVY
ncbi:30S ribosomal protein S8 [endosymbiont of Euscepes postfasciatus]|uniref:30S ribosomal protein S8 n=1 Tax=endosymbiont of Euscepes postfasciatus TaxID=650377 RepID=UPI000DC6E00A|nr:30S ribosomal protein S8 [endosymbiont of Euscepes postfasciatus]BBA84679.1 30S ribosomal protein S8 [endosymbiont of Euscepes postfasciatus]